MNSPVFERVGGSSTNPSPSGSFPTNHFGVALGVRARDAMALATMSVAARVLLPCYAAAGVVVETRGVATFRAPLCEVVLLGDAF